MFKDAFVNDDKDFYKEVAITIEDQEIVIAKIRHLTDLEIGSIYAKLMKNNNLKDNNLENIDITEFVYNLVTKSIEEWIFDKEITLENVIFLKPKYAEPLIQAVNEMRDVWEQKKDK